MKHIFSTIRFKIALHLYSGVAICFMLFLLSLFFNRIPVAKYAMAGTLTSSILLVLFSRKKYLTSIQMDENRIMIHYLNNALIQGSIEMDTTAVEICYVEGRNWWLGELDSMILSDKQDTYKFGIINKKIRKKALRIVSISGYPFAVDQIDKTV